MEFARHEGARESRIVTKHLAAGRGPNRGLARVDSMRRPCTACTGHVRLSMSTPAICVQDSQYLHHLRQVWAVQSQTNATAYSMAQYNTIYLESPNCQLSGSIGQISPSLGQSSRSMIVPWVFRSLELTGFTQHALSALQPVAFGDEKRTERREFERSFRDCLRLSHRTAASGRR